MRSRGMIKLGLLIALAGLVVLSLIVWFALPYFGVVESVQARLLVIVSLVLIGSLFALFGAIRKQKANNAIADGLVEGDDRPTHSQADEERLVIADRFEQAIAELKNKGVGGKSLYDLPWYIMIGPPGSGKTTALRNADLDFPLDAYLGNTDAVKGIGGTRNCDWLFTNEAIFLDTAGRFVTQDSDAEVDKAAWEQFLALLKQNRPRRPINGVLLAIGLDELLARNELEIDQLIGNIRLRLQELATGFNAQLPVYLLVTKSDLMAGFDEFFGDLSREQRAQIFGMTFPLEENPGSNIATQFDTEFQLLSQRLDGLQLTRMHAESDERRRSLIFGFPSQFQSTADALRRVIDRVFSGSRFEKPLLLRGVYFTSGTQEGTPIDRVLGAISRSYGLGTTASLHGAAQGKSYFLSGLLQRVILGEAGISGVNHRVERARAWLQRGTYALVVLLLVVMGAGWTKSYFGNSQLIGDVGGKLAGYREVVATTDQRKLSGYQEILPLLDKVRDVDGSARRYEGDVPLGMGLGLYQGEPLAAYAGDAYTRILNTQLVPRIAYDLENLLGREGNDWELDYESLKTYLMLGNTEHLDAEHMRQWMTLTWRQMQGAASDVPERLLQHLDALLQRGLVPQPLSGDLVAGVRQRLSQRPLVDLVFARLKRDDQARNPGGWSLARALDPDATRVFVSPDRLGINQQIPMLYTARGYARAVKTDIPTLVKQMSNERWVLGQSSALGPLQQNDLKRALMDRYVDEYVRSWQSLLDNIAIADTNTLSAASDVLGQLSSIRSPLRALLLLVEENTSLQALASPAQGAVDALQSGADALGNAGSSRLGRLLQSGVGSDRAKTVSPEEHVEKAFQPLNALVRGGDDGQAPIDKIIAVLSQLNRHMQSMNGGIGGVDALNELARGGDGRALIEQLRGMASRQPQPVARWLETLAKGGSAVTVKGARNQLKSLVKGDVTRECEQLVKGRYPFSPNSNRDVTWEDFGLLFGPGGIIDAFFDNTLKPLVDTSTTRWRWRRSDDVPLGLSTSALRQFQRARRIRDIFFRGGAATPELAFTVKPLSLDNSVLRFSLDIDGIISTYQHGPARATSINWPGTGGSGDVRIVFEDATGQTATINRSGPWAWFRVLDEADTEKQEGGALRATFTAGGYQAEYEIRASSVRNPFVDDDFRNFRCPGAL